MLATVILSGLRPVKKVTAMLGRYLIVLLS
jgi:hypothetical protein